MNIPKYVVDLMERAKYNYSRSNNENYAVGYTIDIAKRTHYQNVDTFKEEIEKLIAWAKREYKKLGGDGEFGEVAYVLQIPKETKHKYMQYGTVTIFDPIMKHIEKYIAQ